MKTAYPNLNQPVIITLFANVPFDNTYKDHSFISSKFRYSRQGTSTSLSRFAKQENFLYRKNANGDYIYPFWILTGEYNFDFTNGLITSLTLELTNEQTNANYLSISVGLDVYYYFITSIKQSNFNTYSLSLELDVIMTYGDEFLQGIKSNPVYTKRKHCTRYYDDYVYSRYYKNGESAFENLKPSLVERFVNANLLLDNRVESEYGGDILTKFSDILWLYIVSDYTDNTYNYSNKEIRNPFTIFCFPINANIFFRDNDNNTYSVGFETGGSNQRNIGELINDGHYKSAKISPYPPFTTLPNDVKVYGDVAGGLTIAGNFNLNSKRDSITFGNNILLIGNNIDSGTTSSSQNDIDKQLSHSIVVHIQFDMNYDFNEMFYQDFTYNEVDITSNRNVDPKLLFKPFKKYCLTSASGEEQEFYPELLTSLSPFAVDDNQLLYLTTIATAYGGDFTTFTYIKEIELSNNVIGYANYRYGKVGLSTTMNYTIPVGENALEVFKSTQSETYYQSKMASGITSGLTIAGGVGSIGLGIAGAVGSMGMSTPVSVGLIASGVGAVASGTASMVDTIKSTNAKIEDLKNTPNSINVSGSSYAHDIAMNINGLLPYVIIYTISNITKNCADDYFYTYGYEIGKDCYFNSSFLSSDSLEDDNIFTRTIFNYVQLQEDISMKINANIPLIAKQKLSNIFNQGIILWTFFGFRSLYPATATIPNESATYDLDKWLYKHTLENKEYKGEYYE